MTAAQTKPKPARRRLWLAVAVVASLLALTTWDALRNSGGNSPAALRRAAFYGDEATVRRLIAAHPEWVDLPGSTNGQASMFGGLYGKTMKALGKAPPTSATTRGDPETQFRELEAVGATPVWHALAGTMQFERVSTVWRACGDETQTSSGASTGGAPNGATLN
jgi:hypothetical protein